MATDKKGRKKIERTPQSSLSRNNAGTIGGDGGIDQKPKGSFHKMTERLSTDPVNERGIRENEEDHSLRDKSKKAPEGSYARNEIDPNKRVNTNSAGEKITYPKKGFNHVDNTGGTSAEELNKNNNL